MTSGNVVAFVPREKFYASDNLQPSKIGRGVKSWIDFLNHWEDPIFWLYCGRFNFQFSKDSYGYFWKTWRKDDYDRTVKFSSRCIVRTTR